MHRFLYRRLFFSSSYCVFTKNLEEIKMLQINFCVNFLLRFSRVYSFKNLYREMSIFHGALTRHYKDATKTETDRVSESESKREGEREKEMTGHGKACLPMFLPSLRFPLAVTSPHPPFPSHTSHSLLVSLSLACT